MARIALFLTMLAASCAGPDQLMQDGNTVAPPQGWVQYCRDHPEDASCR